MSKSSGTMSGREGEVQTTWPRKRVLGDERGIGLIEVMIALIILSIGLLSLAGIAMSVGAQTRLSTWQTDQALAAQEVLEAYQRAGYGTATDGTRTVEIGNRTYTVATTVTDVAPRVKEVEATVSHASRGDISPRTFTTRLYMPRPLPSPPSP